MTIIRRKFNPVRGKLLEDRKKIKHIIENMHTKENIECLEHILDKKNTEYNNILNIIRQELVTDGKDNERKMSTLNFYRKIPQIKNEVEEFLDMKLKNEVQISYRNSIYIKGKKGENNKWYNLGLLTLTLSSLAPLLDLERQIPQLIILSASFGLNGYVNKLREGEDMHYYPADWNNNKGRINVVPNIKSVVLPVFAHEYTHAIQNEHDDIFIRENKYKYFIGEGHARGVQREISRRYAKTFSDIKFLEQIAIYDVNELTTFYKYLGEQKIIRPKKILINKTDSNKSDKLNSRAINEVKYIQKYGVPSPHAIGNSLFLLLEAQHGTGIYKDFINGRFKID